MKQGLKLTVPRDLAMVVIITLSFVTSAYLRNFSLFDHLYDLVRAGFTLVAVFLFLIRKRKSMLWILVAGMFYFLLLFSTFINHNGDYAPPIKNMGFSMGFLVLIDYYLNRNRLMTIKGVRIGLEMLMWINLLTVLLFPKGLYIVANEAHASTTNPGFFLGHRNNSVEVLIPLIGLMMLESHLTKGRLDVHTLVILMASFLTVVLTWSANAIVCIALFVVYFFVLYGNKTSAAFDWKVFFAGSAVVTLLLTVFKILQAFRWFIVGVLHKSMTLSTRTTIWERSLRWIPQKPLLGFGIEDTVTKYQKIRAVNSCHNYFLDLLYTGGVALLAVYLALMIMSMRRVNRIADAKLRSILSVTFGSYCILWIATPMHRPYVCWMYMFWLVTYHLTKNRVVDLRSIRSVWIENPGREHGASEGAT